MIPPEVLDWLDEHGYGQVTGTRPVSGGCINHGTRLQTSSGRSFFLKTNPDASGDMFAQEMEGLQALRVPGGPAIPEAYLNGAKFLLLEDLAPAPHTRDYWPEFGRRLASLHAHTSPRFGFAHDNYLGLTPQPNPWTTDGHEFFATQRLLYQARLARRQGLLGRKDLQKAENLAARLGELIPAQPVSLIHGDLWSGNATSDSHGRPALIDPATHYGWAEAELGMTALFGGFPEAFYQAYEEAAKPFPGYRERFPVYNLYHLLNHLNLFGTGYVGQVQAILRRFG